MQINERRKKPKEASVSSMDISSILGTVPILPKLLQDPDLIEINEIQYCNIEF